MSGWPFSEKSPQKKKEDDVLSLCTTEPVLEPSEANNNNNNGDSEDDFYNVIDSIEAEVHENHKILVMLVKRVKTLDARCKKYESVLERLGEFLEKQTTDNVRQHNRSLRMRVPVPFRSTHTPFSSGLEDDDNEDVSRAQCPHSTAGGNTRADMARTKPNGQIQPPIAYPFDLVASKHQPTCTVGFHRDV